MTTRIIRYAVLLALVALCAGRAYGDEQKYAAINYWDDGVYTLRLDCLSTAMTTRNGKVAERQQDRNTLTWKVDVAKDSDGCQHFTMTLVRLVMRLSNNDSELLFFDSSNDKNPDFAILNAFMVEARQTELDVEALDGKASRITGYSEEFWKKIPEPKDDREKFFTGQLRQLFSDSNLSQVFETLSELDSPGEVAVGEKWVTETLLPLPTGKEETLKWDCVLTAVDTLGSRTVATVKGKGELDVKVDELSQMLVKMEGTVKYDVVAHYPREIVSRVAVSLNREIQDENDEPMKEAVIALQKNNLTIDKH